MSFYVRESECVCVLEYVRGSKREGEGDKSVCSVMYCNILHCPPLCECTLLSDAARTCRSYHELGTSGWTASATSRWSMHF